MRYITIAVSCLALSGCGKGGLATYPVKGSVTFTDGKPLSGATVEFQPTGDQKGKISARGRTGSDGNYHMSTFEEGDGAIEGKHRVLVMSPLPPGPLNAAKPAKPIIDPKYQRFDSSGLEFTVSKDGPNIFDIKVTRP